MTPQHGHAEFTRKQIVDIIALSGNTEVRFTGTSLVGLNLSKLDLSNVQFKNCDLSFADLTEAICVVRLVHSKRLPYKSLALI